MSLVELKSEVRCLSLEEFTEFAQWLGGAWLVVTPALAPPFSMRWQPCPIFHRNRGMNCRKVIREDFRRIETP